MMQLCILESIFEKNGFEVSTAQNGYDAFKLVTENIEM